MKNLNSIYNEFTAKDWDSANINIKDNSVSFSDIDSNQVFAGGINGIKSYWWGKKLFLNDNLTKTTYQALAAGAGAAYLVGVWAPWFSVPTALIKAVAVTVATVFGGAAAMFYQTNKGKGVYLRFTGPKLFLVYTGMFAQ